MPTEELTRNVANKSSRNPKLGFLKDIRNLQRVVTVFNRTPILINYNETIEELFKAAGYEQRVREINSENFPTPQEKIGKKVTEIFWTFSFNWEISLQGVILEMAKKNCIPAGGYLLSHFGVFNKEIPLDYAIIAPKDQIEHHRKFGRFVPVMHKICKKMGIGLYPCDHYFPAGTIFLGIESAENEAHSTQ